MNKLTTNQVAEMAGVTPSAVRYWVREEGLEAKPVPYPVSEGGEQYRYEPDDVLIFLMQKHTELMRKNEKIKNKLSTIRNSINQLRGELYEYDKKTT